PPPPPRAGGVGSPGDPPPLPGPDDLALGQEAPPRPDGGVGAGRGDRGAAVGDGGHLRRGGPPDPAPGPARHRRPRLGEGPLPRRPRRARVAPLLNPRPPIPHLLEMGEAGGVRKRAQELPAVALGHDPTVAGGDEP